MKANKNAKVAPSQEEIFFFERIKWAFLPGVNHLKEDRRTARSIIAAGYVVLVDVTCQMIHEYSLSDL